MTAAVRLLRVYAKHGLLSDGPISIILPKKLDQRRRPRFYYVYPGGSGGLLQQISSLSQELSEALKEGALM